MLVIVNVTAPLKDIKTVYLFPKSNFVDVVVSPLIELFDQNENLAEDPVIKHEIL